MKKVRIQIGGRTVAEGNIDIAELLGQEKKATPGASITERCNWASEYQGMSNLTVSYDNPARGCKHFSPHFSEQSHALQVCGNCDYYRVIAE